MSKKVGVCVLGVFLFIFVHFSIAFAATSVVPIAQCNQNNIIAYLSGPTNAHISLTPSAGHDHVLCFESVANENEAVITFTNKKADYGFNRLLRLSAPTNAHVAQLSHTDYSSILAYDGLDCRLSTSATLRPSEQIIARLSRTTNAHISNASDSNFPQYLICQEQICNLDRYQTLPVFPSLANFEDGEQIQITPSAGGGVAFSLQAVQKAKGAKALRMDFTFSDTDVPPKFVQLTNKISDLSMFTRLEFQYYFTSVSGLAIEFVSADGSVQRELLDLHILSPQRNTWNTVSIDLSKIDTSSQITHFRFVVDPSYSTLAEIPKAYTYFIDFMNVYGVDELRRQYCAVQFFEGQTIPNYIWTSDLDAIVSPDSCTNVPGFMRTNTKCCGDDGLESFSDGTKGCFAGSVLESGTFFDVVSYQINGVVKSNLCLAQNWQACVFPFPVLEFAASNAVVPSLSAPTLLLSTEGYSSIIGSNAISARGLISPNQPLQVGFFLDGRQDTVPVHISFSDSSLIPNRVQNPILRVIQNGVEVQRENGLFELDTQIPVFVVISAPESTTGEILLELTVDDQSSGFTEFSSRGFVSSTQQLIMGYQPKISVDTIIGSGTEYLKSVESDVVATGDSSIELYKLTPSTTQINSNDNYASLSQTQKDSISQFTIDKGTIYSLINNDPNAAALYVLSEQNQRYTVNIKGTSEGEVLAQIFFVKKLESSQEFVGPVIAQSQIIPGQTGFSLVNISQKAQVNFDDNRMVSTVPKQIVATMYRATYAYGIENKTRTEPIQPEEYGFFFCSGSSGFANIPTIPSAALTTISYGSTPAIGSACRIVNDAYCSPRGFFSQEFKVENTQMNISRSIDGSTYECCPSNSCYNNNRCYADQFSGQSTTGFEQVQNNVCYQGVWKPALTKINYDGRESGFCPEQSMCFVSSSYPGKCINSGKHYQNYYCQEGNWTSRTALLAQVMTEIAYTDSAQFSGTIYCDNLATAGSTISINRFSVHNNIALQGLLTQCSGSVDTQCTAYSACVLTTNAQTMFGIVLNKPITQITGFEDAFRSGCMNKGQSGLEPCETNGFRYDNTTQLFIYSQSQKTFTDYVVQFWRQLLVDPIRSLFTGTTLRANDLRNLESSSNFEKLYYATTNEKTVAAYFEWRGNTTSPTLTPYYVISYPQVGINLCEDVVTPYNLQNAQAKSNPVSCVSTDDSTYTIVGTSSTSGLWPYLTGRLRP